jgi:hypothetical protein
MLGTYLLAVQVNQSLKIPATLTILSTSQAENKWAGKDLF